MNFGEKYEQIQRQADTRRLLDTFQGTMDYLILNKPELVSFQIAYDQVFKLTKLGRQADILNILDEKLAALLKGKLVAEKKQNLAFLHSLLIEVKEVAERMTEICLFLDVNYCQKAMHVPLSKRLNNNIFRTFISDSKALGLLARAAFEARESTCAEFEAVLQFIDEIDEKHEFFEQHLIPHYIPLVSEHYRKAAAEEWQRGDLPKFITWSRLVMQQEETFIDKLQFNKKRREPVDAVLASIYEAVVSDYKSRIYQTDEAVLFEQLTLPILQLLRFGKGKEVEGHIQWFMGVLEKRLNKIGTEDNTSFINCFCELYDKVSELLKGTQSKFEINYRSIFAFEEWINNQKFNIPLRLNVYIDERFVRPERQNPQLFLRRVILVFKLVKEKNLFQNMYRRTLINRFLRFYLTYDLSEEQTLIDGMAQECGQEWSQKIKSICEQYLIDRDRFIKEHPLAISKGPGGLVGGLVPLVVREDDWPFESRTMKTLIHAELLKLTSAYQKGSISQSKPSKLSWSTNAGTVILQIGFKGTKRLFLVSVNMANLLLYIQKTPKKLTHFLSEHCYAMDEVEEPLQLLISRNVIISQQEGSDFTLRLSDEFEEGGLVDLVWSSRDRKLEVRVMEELKADRKLMVEAMIVKIMKAEKMLRRAQLLQKSAPLVQQRGFKFNEQFVGKSIDRLIQKQFIRDFEDGNLGYIA